MKPSNFAGVGWCVVQKGRNITLIKHMSYQTAHARVRKVLGGRGCG